MNRIVFVVPQMDKLGGVALHYKGLREYWSEEVYYCELKSFEKNGLLHRLYVTFYNIFNFIKVLITWSPTHVILNTSLKKGFFTQYYHWRIAKIFKKKVGLFIHGWDVEHENEYLDNPKCKKYLKGVNGIFLLSSKFKECIEKKGISTPVYVVTTKVDNSLLEGFDITKKEFLNRRFLFLARLIKEKGIYETIDTFQLIQKQYPDATFDIVGDGIEKANVENYIKEKNIPNIKVHGQLSGQLLSEAYVNADYYFLLSWGEGLPGSLLEAISFGLIPIVRGVGGIPEVFQDEEMGIMSSEKNPEYYANRILQLMSNPENTQAITLKNYRIGQEKFLASAVAKRFENILSIL